jgi:hypothetical protein
MPTVTARAVTEPAPPPDPGDLEWSLAGEREVEAGPMAARGSRVITSHGLEIGPGLAIGHGLGTTRVFAPPSGPTRYRDPRTFRFRDGGKSFRSPAIRLLFWAAATVMVIAMVGAGLVVGRPLVIQAVPAASSIYAAVGFPDRTQPAATDEDDTEATADPGCAETPPAGRQEDSDRQGSGCGAGPAEPAPR